MSVFDGYNKVSSMCKELCCSYSFGCQCHVIFDIYFPIIAEPSSAQQVDVFGRTSLMYAVHFGHNECLSKLLNCKIDVNYQAHGKILIFTLSDIHVYM